MKRFKNPGKNSDKKDKIPTHFIMSVIMPCVMLACKDVFKADQKQLDKLGEAVERYLGYIGDGKVTLKQLHEMMEVREKGGKDHGNQNEI